MTGIPKTYSFLRYLAAKKGLDDRSLNRHVRETLAGQILTRQEDSACRVLEVGCGIGTMLERLIDWQLLAKADYTGIDLHPDSIGEARRRFRRFAAARGADLALKAGRFLYRQPGQAVGAEFEAIDLFHFLTRERGRGRWDLIIAHAFLDLVDLKTTLPELLSLLVPGGFFYFTLNFDGATIFKPAIDAGLDQHLETLYHQTMDQRLVGGRLSGSSRTGRMLFEHLKNAGALVLAAGSSDWVVFPGPAGYPGDEAYFLHFIIHIIYQALKDHPELPQSDLQGWIEQRHAQILQGKLIYFARQLDFFGQV
ncbi:MAG: class I SAM-dependent methyltransferase [Deltaproteobacteria bacterium]|nr:class I SAM-dependent methyltransferase [Deltaproteobacteria bacterium]